MSRIRRSDFIDTNRNKQLDLNKLGQDPQARDALRQAGLSEGRVQKADINGDGFVRGRREMSALFSQIDHVDRDGSYGSIATTDASGAATRSGKAMDILSGKLEATREASAADEFGRLLAEGGKESVRTKQAAHEEAIDEYGVGKYFGNKSSYASKSFTEKQEWLKSQNDGVLPPHKPKRASCIGWALDNVGEAYRAAGKGDRWATIERKVIANGAKGTVLAAELQKDGWEAVYFNPDEKKPDDGNQEHPYTASITRAGKPYYGIKVDHRVTNYRPTSGSGTEKDMSSFEELKKVPFFFGLAKGGMHTFVGVEGNVNEFHWSENPSSKHAIEERALPDFPWNSGVIMVPPGTWPAD